MATDNKVSVRVYLDIERTISNDNPMLAAAELLAYIKNEYGTAVATSDVRVQFSDGEGKTIVRRFPTKNL